MTSSHTTFTIRLLYMMMYFLFLLLLLPETSALRIPDCSSSYCSPLVKCSTVAFWSRNADHAAPIVEGLSTSSLSVATTATTTATSPQRKKQKVATTTTTKKKKFKNIEEVLESFHEEPIGLFFGMKSCGPCQSMKEEMKQVHSALGNELLLFHVDIDRWPSVATKMDVTHAPTLLLFQQGQVQLRMEGMMPAETVLQELNTYLGDHHHDDASR